MQNYTKDEIQALTKDEIRALKSEQIKALESEQIEALVLYKTRALTQVQIRALEPEQIQALRQNALLNTVDQVLEASKINPALIQLLSVDEIRALTAGQFKVLTAGQLAALTEEQLSILKILGEDKILLLQPDQRNALKANIAKIQALKRRNLELDEPGSPRPDTSSAVQSTSWVQSSKKRRCTSLPLR